MTDHGDTVPTWQLGAAGPNGWTLRRRDVPRALAPTARPQPAEQRRAAATAAVAATQGVAATRGVEAAARQLVGPPPALRSWRAPRRRLDLLRALVVPVVPMSARPVDR